MRKESLFFVGLCCLWLLAGCAGPLQWRSTGPALSQEERRKLAMRKLAMHYFVKAKIYEAQDKYYAAIVALRNAADLDPTSPTIYAQLAWDYNEIHDYQMAAVFARKALELDPERTELRYLHFQLLQLSGDLPGAIRTLERLLESQPRHWRLYFQLAQLYMEADQHAKRIEPLFERALKHPDTPVEVKVNMGDILARSGQQEKARAIYTAVLEKDPDVEDAWLGLADFHKARGDTTGAIQYYRRAAQVLSASSLAFIELANLIQDGKDLEEILATEDAGFLYKLGSTFFDRKQYNLATKVFEHIVDLRPASVEEWLDLARYYIALKNYERADEILSQAATAMPDSSSILFFWGMAMESTGQFEKAIDIYRQGLQHHPEESEFYWYWGIALEQQEEWDQAIQVYRRGLQLDPPHPELHIRWGIVLGKQQKWDEAIEHYRGAAALDSLHSEVFLHWGIALEKLGRWDEAIEKLSQAVELDDKDPHVLFYLGSCFEQAARASGDSDYFDHAIKTFEQLLEIDPTDAYALNYLGYMYADKGIRLEEAVELVRRAIALVPENSAFFDSLGWAFYRLGEFERAEHYLDKALAILDEHEAEEKAIILDHAGDIARALGKEAEARAHWQRALELEPDNEAVKGKLELTGTP